MTGPLARGFTLIELLVAITIMATMTIMGWRGIDTMMRTKEQARQRSDDIAGVQTGLTQWGADLDAWVEQTGQSTLDWDGRALRLLRRASAEPGGGLLVVAWGRRNIDGQGQWLRWQSAPVKTRGELQQAWQQASQWAQNPGDEDRRREVSVLPLEQWQVFYFRNDAWSNPLSSGDAAAVPDKGGAPAAAPTPGAPDGVRLVLTLPPGHVLGGVLTRDWIRPTVGGNKS